MTDYWRIGTVYLPPTCWPRTVRYHIEKDIKEISTYLYLPLALSLGPMIPRLDLEGFFWEPGLSQDELEEKYIKPFINMVWYGSTTRRVLFDDNGSAFWTMVEGSGSDDTSTYVRGRKSFKISVSNEFVHLYHDWGEPQNFLYQDFVSLWFRGRGTNDYIYLYFWNENYDSRTNGYFFRFRDTKSSWRRIVIPKLCFSNKGSPEWNSIKCIEILSSVKHTGTFYLDRLALGIGAHIWCPFMRYVGIWVLQQFEYEDSYRFGNQAFYYRMTFLNQDDHY